MNSNESSGNWEAQKNKLKKKFAALTNSDLLFKKGKKEEIIASLQIILGKNREEILKIIEEL